AGSPPAAAPASSPPGAHTLALARKDGTEAVGRAARQHFLDLMLWIFVGAMIGARLLFIVVNWSGPNGYGANPARIFQIWSGGLVFYGGFIGAAVASVLYARKHRLNFRAVADIAIPRSEEHTSELQSREKL